MQILFSLLIASLFVSATKFTNRNIRHKIKPYWLLNDNNTDRYCNMPDHFEHIRDTFSSSDFILSTKRVEDLDTVFSSALLYWEAYESRMRLLVLEKRLILEQFLKDGSLMTMNDTNSLVAPKYLYYLKRDILYGGAWRYVVESLIEILDAEQINAEPLMELVLNIFQEVSAFLTDFYRTLWNVTHNKRKFMTIEQLVVFQKMMTTALFLDLFDRDEMVKQMDVISTNLLSFHMADMALNKFPIHSSFLISNLYLLQLWYSLSGILPTGGAFMTKLRKIHEKFRGERVFLRKDYWGSVLFSSYHPRQSQLYLDKFRSQYTLLDFDGVQSNLLSMITPDHSVNKTSFVNVISGTQMLVLEGRNIHDYICEKHNYLGRFLCDKKLASSRKRRNYRVGFERAYNALTEMELAAYREIMSNATTEFDPICRSILYGEKGADSSNVHFVSQERQIPLGGKSLAILCQVISGNKFTKIGTIPMAQVTSLFMSLFKARIFIDGLTVTVNIPMKNGNCVFQFERPFPQDKLNLLIAIRIRSRLKVCGLNLNDNFQFKKT